MASYMPFQFKIIWSSALTIAGLCTLYGLGHWGYNMDWLNSYDQWIVDNAKYPGSFGIIIGLAIGTVFIPEAINFIKYLNAKIENRGLGVLQIPTMSVHDIAEYLYRDSVWGQRSFCNLNFKEFVKNAIPVEMTRAAAAYEVRFIGALPDTIEAIEIDRNYWKYCTIDEIRIWDKRNNFFTKGNGAYKYTMKHMQHGCAPKIDVYKTWPKASFIRKICSILYVKLKIRLINLRHNH